MGRCVDASSKLGREIRPVRRRYAQLESRHRHHWVGHQREEITSEDVPVPPEKADTYVDIYLKDDGSLDDLPNPGWPRGWDTWPPPASKSGDWLIHR